MLLSAPATNGKILGILGHKFLALQRSVMHGPRLETDLAGCSGEAFGRACETSLWPREC
jgi:hypothetical protein